MRALTHTLIAFALFIISGTAVQAQSYTYSSIRKDYVYSDGFGIPHSKTIRQRGSVRVDKNEVYIDDVKYRMDSEGTFKNEKGKAVDLSYVYDSRKLVTVRISTGHIINNYILDKASPNAVVHN